MSRKFVLIALGTMMSAPLWAQGQTPVRASAVPRGRGTSPLDTMRAMLQWRNPTIDEVVAWSAEVAKRLDELKVVNEKMRREAVGANDARQMQLKEETIRTVVELQQAQRLLLDVCKTIRPHEGESEGVLGFQIEIGGGTAFQQTGPAVKEERFVRAPAISFVEPNTPAAKADIRPGDIWTAIAGRDLVNMYVHDLNDVLKPGNRVDLKLLRDGREVKVDVTARKRREYPEEACNEDRLQMDMIAPGQPKIQLFGGPLPSGGTSFFTMKILKSVIGGAVFGDLTNEKRSALKAPLNEGVLVEEISPGSPADVAGLREFDVVTRVNNEVIESMADFTRVTKQASGSVSLWVYREGVGRGVTLPTGR